MNGYAIIYTSADGTAKTTFFSEPVSNMAFAKRSGKLAARVMFHYACPGCEISSIEPMSYNEYKNFYEV